ncbi:MAG: amidase [Candidatus Dormibacter sp.]|uniref:amidase n=1 Tax=Candidatus Dormibacter sp. TaxID=2973982 RepID=UPI002683A82F
MTKQELAWLTATEIRSLLAAGEIQSGDVVAAHLERIAGLNPALAAYVHVDPLAASGAGLLAGTSVAVKDTQPVTGMPWTHGSPRYSARVADHDAIAVSRLRRQGAAILGKSNLPELAAAVGTTNPLFPPAHNPWRHGITPGGSSGGSGAAVAAGLCTFATGDDMGGSIRIPSACCGVVGLRPSRGLVADEQPDPTGLSVQGPLARSVADLRLVLAFLAAPQVPPNAASRPLRIGVVRQSSRPIAPECAAACNRAALALSGLGHELGEVDWDPETFARAYQVVRPASVASQPGDPSEYGESAGRLIAAGRRLALTDYLSALESGLAAGAALREQLTRWDAILSPTLGRLPMAIEAVPTFLSAEWSEYTQFVLPVSFAGLPAVSVPAGFADGLPVGVQLIGGFGQDWALLDLAQSLEAEDGFGFVRPPDIG